MPRRLRCLMASLSMLFATPILCGTNGLTNGFEARALAAHNRERAAMGVPALAWDDSLRISAQRWADHLAARGGFEHAPEGVLGDEGENLWAGTRGYYSVDAMVDAWVREKRHFRMATFPHNSTTGDVEDIGHYTQLIWRETHSVGCAMATGPREDVMVCRYSEPGNWIGERPI